MSRGPVCGVDCSLLTTTAHLMSSDRQAVGSPGQSNSSFMSPGRVDTHDLHRTHGGGHPATQEPQSCSAPWGSQEETPAEVSLASSPTVATLPTAAAHPECPRLGHLPQHGKQVELLSRSKDHRTGPKRQ